MSLSIRNLLKLLVVSTSVLFAGCSGGILDPKGQVGADEKQLIIIATVLMLLVVIPVIVMTLYFAWKYREGRGEAFAPKWAHSTKIEVAVWSIPVVIVAILGVITWRSTHQLDPYKPLEGKGQHLTVEVVSLNWKWLFIYPELGIASVNELVFPQDVPVEFKITSQSTMNSFFIPQLGSQIYSMAGMQTKLHLIADEPGTYDGFSANYSGEGFTGMSFSTIATASEADFDNWVAAVKASDQHLNTNTYAALSENSENEPVAYYATVEQGLFDFIVMQYMHPHDSAKMAEHAPQHHHQGGQH